jgi:hypothetical protein
MIVIRTVNIPSEIKINKIIIANPDLTNLNQLDYVY